MSNTERVVKRTYDSALRREHAQLTRRLVIAAAGRLFATQGYAATSMDQIAEVAGVGRATVFTAVGGKVALLEAAWNVALVGDDEEVALPDRPESRAIMAESDPRRFLSRYIALVVEIDARAAGIYEAVRGAATADPAIEALYTKIQAGRYTGATHVVELLRGKGGLRPDLAPETAADILWTLLEPMLYRLLVHERGWPLDRYRSWLDQMVQAALMPAPSVDHNRSAV